MTRTVLGLLLCLCGICGVTFAQDKPNESELLREIAKGHEQLAKDIECLSGVIEERVSNSEKDKSGYLPIPRVFFFKDNDLWRLEYEDPKKETVIYPEHPKNKITKVLVSTPEHYYDFWAIGTTGVPYANLFKKEAASESDKSVIYGKYSMLGALFAVGSIPNTNVADYLLNEIESIEYREYEDLPNALWIKGVELQDQNEATSNWTIVLDPQQHYALRFYETVITVPQTQVKYEIRGTRTVQITSDGKVFPKEIEKHSTIETIVDGKKQTQHMDSLSSVIIESTDRPDPKLFTEESFKELGRDFVVIPVSASGERGTGETVYAAPLEARTSDYIARKNSKLTWLWGRVLFAIVGAALIATACLIKFFGKKKEN